MKHENDLNYLVIGVGYRYFRQLQADMFDWNSFNTSSMFSELEEENDSNHDA